MSELLQDFYDEKKEICSKIYLNNEVVYHKQYGSGVVSKLNNCFITVKFEDFEKKFVFPDVFRTILKLKDNAKMNEIIDLINQSDSFAETYWTNII